MTEFDISTSTPKERLARLAHYLETLPDTYLHFDMESYFHDPARVLENERDEIVNSIDLILQQPGMCGCVIGHTAAAGLMIPDAMIRAQHWRDVGEIVYGISGEAFDYLFGGDWYVRDNTPQGAANRIQTYLGDGIPPYWAIEKDELCEV